ncbi:hypothetical protein JQS43_11280 [Natronosporangium hydrolyticum]|uniref:Uncharacterized protein n=1 Tax=Natronosporangium hydrolyticum TaxID=2811111 RepID=A0A895YS13_9ACTN|nr:hypothetical protein [Natronosporangium hydrolyticum]QSB16808.1 hypothetical protein JQS43_11280 [Natronosporangium hydrolyticum]
MALEMDPERKRKLKELARVHAEWQAQHGVDDEEHTPVGAAAPQGRRPPTPEQEAEFWRRASEVMGYDPETGRYRGDQE